MTDSYYLLLSVTNIYILLLIATENYFLLQKVIFSYY